MDQKQKRNSIEGSKKALAALAARIEPPIELSPAETRVFRLDRRGVVADRLE